MVSDYCRPTVPEVAGREPPYTHSQGVELPGHLGTLPALWRRERSPWGIGVREQGQTGSREGQGAGNRKAREQGEGAAREQRRSWSREQGAGSREQ